MRRDLVLRGLVPAGIARSLFVAAEAALAEIEGMSDLIHGDRCVTSHDPRTCEPKVAEQLREIIARVHEYQRKQVRRNL